MLIINILKEISFKNLLIKNNGLFFYLGYLGNDLNRYCMKFLDV